MVAQPRDYVGLGGFPYAKKDFGSIAIIALAWGAHDSRNRIAPHRGHGEGLVVGSDAGRAVRVPVEQTSRNIKHGHTVFTGCNLAVATMSSAFPKRIQNSGAQGLTLLISQWRS